MLWVEQRSPLDTRWRTIAALGSYTDPAHRSAGLAAQLRTEALRMCRERGYQRVTGPVHMTNPKGIEVFMKDYGAWPTSVTFELLL